MAFYSQQPDALLLHCLVQPKASRDQVVGLQDERLKIRITAPPVDGKANAHLLRFLADLFDVPRSRIALVAGDTGRRKTFRLDGVTALPASLQSLGNT